MTTVTAIAADWDAIDREGAEEGRRLLLEHGSGLAKQMHEAQLAEMVVRDRIGSVLMHAFGGAWEESTTDYYDNSIEVYGAEPTPEAIEILHRAGFAIVWVHPHPPGRQLPDGTLCKCPGR